MKNIIVLTSGLSGSSVVTNLLSKAGYWTGDLTCQKTDYNTHENSQLVYLNDLLLKTVDYDKSYSVIVNSLKVTDVELLFDTIDLSPFKALINQCEKSKPWVWKDPRLWVTMPFWIQLLEKDSFHVVFVDRSVSQRWISELLRKNVQTYSYCKQYNFQIEQLIKKFIANHELKSCDVLFDHLVEQPRNTLLLINQFLGSSLTMDDLLAVYNKPLYKKVRGVNNLLQAVLIYLKNYQTRLK